VESVLTASAAVRRGPLVRIRGSALGIWALSFLVVLYLGLQGGGYDVIVSGQVGLVLWWALLIVAAAGILPRRRLPARAWAGVALLAAFAGWTALACMWSISVADSLQELSRVCLYLSVLVLGLAVFRDRERALRHCAAAIAAAVVVIAALAVVSRLVPGSFPASEVTGAYLPSARQRLSWPLNYWNGLATLMALGLPLLLALATSARALWAQALAAAAVPLVALCAYLTFSRGGAVEIGVAVAVFLALAPERFPRLATLLVCAAASAILIVGALARSAVEHGLVDHQASVQGRGLLTVAVIVCFAVALAQRAIGLAARHAELPRVLRLSAARARLLLAGGVAVAVVAALLLGVPGELAHAWHDFKHNAGAVSQSNLPGRFASLSGEGRYQYWKVALEATSDRRLIGSGPGTFQLLWQPRATFYSPVINAHSLYIETLAEVGVIGLALLVGLFAVLLVAAGRLVVGSDGATRAYGAACAGALLAFMVAAAVDWVWQLPVLPCAFMLIGAAVLAPAPARLSVREWLQRRRNGHASGGDRVGGGVSGGTGGTASGEASPDGPYGQWALAGMRVGLGVVALACLVAIAVPLAAVSYVRDSQAAVGAGELGAALADARSAVRVEPGGAPPELQLALVQELRGDYPAALAAARAATRDEPQNWTEWLVLSRLEAESGHPRAALVDYRRARSLNPTSPLFGP